MLRRGHRHEDGMVSVFKEEVLEAEEKAAGVRSCSGRRGHRHVDGTVSVLKRRCWRLRRRQQMLEAALDREGTDKKFRQTQ